MNRTIAAITIASILLPVAAHSAFKLDSRYQDRDGDLVADIPDIPILQVPMRAWP